MKKKWNTREASLEDAYGLRLCMDFTYAPYKERMNGLRLPPMDSDYEFEIQHFPTWVVDFDGKVAGGGLMKFAEKTAKEKKYTQLRLATHVLLHENIVLYLHLGWQEIDRNAHKVMMKKEI